MDKKYKICCKCIMDTTDPDITFDEYGICNHCRTYEIELPKRIFSGEVARQKFGTLVADIKSDGRNADYDCIVGVSGGVDSTYVAYLVNEQGLRPLAVHFDNGWNSELAVSNIKKTLDALKIDLYTYVIDWEEFSSLQLAFLKASTPDGEIPTDHAINALLFHEAAKRNIKYIISGMNYATESGSVPAWAYGHMDWRYISGINKIFGHKKLRHYPHLNFFELAWWTFVKQIKVVSILNYVEYNKNEAMKILQEKLDWIYYGGKHYESVYTRFFQGYMLPVKFGIDKRILHFSSLILSGQITRERALIDITNNDYFASGLADADKIYVQKKFKLAPDEFEEVMRAPRRTFRNYPNSYRFVVKLKRVINFLRKLGLVSK